MSGVCPSQKRYQTQVMSTLNSEDTLLHQSHRYQKTNSKQSQGLKGIETSRQGKRYSSSQLPSVKFKNQGHKNLVCYDHSNCQMSERPKRMRTQGQTSTQTVEDLLLQYGQLIKEIKREHCRSDKLSQLISLIKRQNYLHGTDITQKNTDQETVTSRFHNIQEEFSTIQKIQRNNNRVSEHNATLKKKIFQCRKNRVLYERHLSRIQSEIKKVEYVYKSLLCFSLDNRFLNMMCSSQDIVSIGSFIALEGESYSQTKRLLQKNQYTDLEEDYSNQPQHTIQDQSPKCQRFIGKKGIQRKLKKMMSIVESSKKLTESALALYEQGANVNKKKQKNSFKKQIRTVTINDRVQSISRNYGTEKISFKKLKVHKESLSHRESVSIGHFLRSKTMLEQDLMESFVSLERLYHCLGVRVYDEGPILDIDVIGKDSQFIKKSQQRLLIAKHMAKDRFRDNAYLQRKIKEIVQLISEVEGRIEIIQRHQTLIMTQGFNTENQESQIRCHSKCSCYDSGLGSDQKILQNIHNIFYPFQKSFFDEKENDFQQLTYRNILNFVDIVATTETSTQRNGEGQDRKFSLTRKTNSSQQRQNTDRVNKVKAEDIENKGVHFLGVNKDRFVKTSKLSEMTPDVYQNGMKSLNSIFSNMEICNSYQKVFERQDFEKKYQKQIEKKKRVMLRRRGHRADSSVARVTLS